MPDTRPRRSGGAIRISSPSADTVNMVEPIPPSDRNSRSCQYVCATAQRPVETATTVSPVM